MATKKDHLTQYIADSRRKSEAFDRAWQYRLLVRKLVKRRHDLGLTQQDVADSMGVARERITEIEGARKTMGTDRLLHYASILDVEIRLVMARESKRKPSESKVAERRARYKAG